MAGKPITQEEALQYDPDALLLDCEKRKNNIKIFEDTIANELKAITENRYMIAQIDPNHPDAKKLAENTEKMKQNIQTFEEAIIKENEEIARDTEMIQLINASRTNKPN